MASDSRQKRRGDNGNGASNAKRKPNTNHELAGCLTSRSHLLHSDPECCIFEICSSESVNHILFKRDQLTMNNLNIGQCYKFQYLHRGSLVLKGDTVKCYRATDLTVVTEVNIEYGLCLPSYLDNLAVITGEVTDVNSALGICYLNRSKMVIFSTCSRVACLPIPAKGQNITIFNAHPLKDENGVTIFAMCVKSFISIDGEDNCKIHQPQFSKELLILGDAVRDYRLILWLQKCSIFIEKNFDSSFLHLHGISEIHCKEFRSTLLQNIAKVIMKNITVQRNSTVEEFMASDHQFRCGVLKEVMPSLHLCNLQKVNEKHCNLEDESNEEGENINWQYDVKKNAMNVLIGLISFRNTNFRLTLSDANCSIPLIVLCNDGEKLVKLQNSIVLVMEHNFIRERFSTPMEIQTSHNFKYLSVALDKVHILSTLHKNIKNSHLEGVQITRESSRCSGSRMKASVNINVSKAISAGNSIDTIPIQSISTSGKKSLLKSYLSQFLFVQTKSSAVVKKDKLTRRCYLLATLLGEMTKSSTGCHQISTSRKETKQSIFICLENSLLRVVPFITVNSVLEIRFSVDFDENFFKKGSPLGYIEGLVTMLPTIRCVTLPSNAEIHLVNNNSLLTDNFKFRDCYGILQSLNEANFKELIDIVGYVVGRYNQEPKFEREKTSIKVNGFGVPGNKVIALILSDTPPGNQAGTPVTLYMSNSTSPSSVLQYPFGLVPGAKVIFRFVVKVKPSTKTSGVYFRSSVMTSVEIIEVAKSERNNEEEGMKDLWGLRCLLPSVQRQENLGCTWITVSMASLIKVTINATCSACKYPVKDKKCTFVGCSAPDECTIYSQATLKVYEFGAKPTLIFVPDNLVPKLFLDSEGLWDNLLKLAQCNGQLQYGICKSSQDTALYSLEERVFRQLCGGALQGKRFHLLCRQFRKKGNEEDLEDTLALYAVDLTPVSKVMAAS